MHPNVLVCISSVSSNVIAYNSKIPTMEKCPSLLWLIRHNCKLCVRSQGTHPGYVSLNGIGRTVKHEIILTDTTLLFMHGYKWFTIWARVNQYLTMHRYHAKMAKSKLHAKVLVCIVHVPSKVIAYNRKNRLSSMMSSTYLINTTQLQTCQISRKPCLVWFSW